MARAMETFAVRMVRLRERSDCTASDTSIPSRVVRTRKSGPGRRLGAYSLSPSDIAFTNADSSEATHRQERREHNRGSGGQNADEDDGRRETDHWLIDAGICGEREHNCDDRE